VPQSTDAEGFTALSVGSSAGEGSSDHTHLKKDRDDDLSWWAGVVDRFLEEGKTVLALRELPLPEPLLFDLGAISGVEAR
jgi:hypothetical protein